jgi:nitrate reductase NapE component
LYAGIPIIKVKVLAPAPPPPKPSAPKEEAEEEGESKAWYERAWDWLKGAFGAIGRAFGAVGRAVANVFKYAVGYGMMGIVGLAKGLGNAIDTVKNGLSRLKKIDNTIASGITYLVQTFFIDIVCGSIGAFIGGLYGLIVSMFSMAFIQGSPGGSKISENYNIEDMPYNSGLQVWPPEPDKNNLDKRKEPPRFYAYDPRFPPQPVPEDDLPWWLRP